MIKKENKLMLAVSADPDERSALVRRLAIECGFALTPSDAAKIITQNIYDIDISKAFFIIADNYNFRGGVITTQRLYELAARGICVILGVRSIPREYQFICSAFYPSDFSRL